MANAQVSKLVLANTVPTAQVSKLEFSIPSVTTTVAQVSRLTLSLPAAAPTLTVAVSPTGPVASGTSVTMTATVGGSWNGVIGWSQVAGDPVILAGTDLVKTFGAPANAFGTLMQFAVNAQGSGDDTTVFVSVTVTPHAEWYMEAGVWVPSNFVFDAV